MIPHEVPVRSAQFGHISLHYKIVGTFVTNIRKSRRPKSVGLIVHTYDEIITELKFALQECGRRVARHISRRRRVADEDKKRRYIESYIPHIGGALQDILGLSDKRRDLTIEELTGMLERQRNM